MPLICRVCCARDPKGAFYFHDFLISRWRFGGLVEAATTVFWGNADMRKLGKTWFMCGKELTSKGRHQILPSLLNFLHWVCKQSFHPLFQNCWRDMQSWRYTSISNVWDMNTDMYILFVKQGSNCILAFFVDNWHFEPSLSSLLPFCASQESQSKSFRRIMTVMDVRVTTQTFRAWRWHPNWTWPSVDNRHRCASLDLKSAGLVTKSTISKTDVWARLADPDFDNLDSESEFWRDSSEMWGTTWSWEFLCLCARLKIG